MGQSIVDWVELGRLIKIARESYGYTRGLDLANALEEKTGLRVSERTIYNIESGDFPPKLEVFLAMQQTMPKLLNAEYLEPAFKNDIKMYLINTDTGETVGDD